MYSFNVNGQRVETDKEMALIDFLRDIMDLTSVKNGCKEGACGTCMILVDGKKMRACLLTTKKVQDKSILTVEGLTQYEKDVYHYAFATAGAVQCGFCIPGMVISAKALLDENNDPTIEDVQQAIQGNICRCTGYKKIIEGIQLAGECLRGLKTIENSPRDGGIGQSVMRPDAKEKVLGTGKFTDDLKVPGMIFGSALRSKYPRALVKGISIDKAMKHPDAVKIVLAEDVPGERFLGHLTSDWPALIAVGEETRYLGDAIALVASNTKEGLEEIKALIEVDYEERQPVFDPEEALVLEDYKIHEQGNLYRKEVIQRGDVDQALAQAACVVTNTYTTPHQEHAFLEPESALAVPDGDDPNGLTVYTGGQSIYDEYREIGHMLGEEVNLRIISSLVGGGFGGKEDMSVQHHAALLGYLTKQPVKVTLSRQESILVHPKRHPMKMTVTTACDREGHITAVRMKVISDTGAYASLGGPVLQRACTHAAGPYNFDNIDIEGYAVYTNNVPSGAFRGFGVTQTMFASEANLSLLAEKIGMDAYDIRYLNAVRPGQTLPNGQLADEGTSIVETLEAVKDIYKGNIGRAGIACAIKNAGIGMGVPDIGRVKLKILDGKVIIRTSAACMGQGIAGTMRAICCETTGLNIDLVTVDKPDTSITPDSGTSTASRQTVITGETTRRVSLRLAKDLESTSLRALEGKEYYEEFTGITDPLGSKKHNPISHLNYGYATQVVVLDEDGKVTEVAAAHDVGKAINPVNVEGQIEGGVMMGLGYALTENMKIVDGLPTARMGTLGLFRAKAMPKLTTLIVERNTSELAYGAKGVGEIPVIPTAPALQHAYYKLDGIFRTSLPLEKTAYRK